MNSLSNSAVFYSGRAKTIGLFFISLLFTLASMLMIIIGFNLDVGIDISVKDGTNLWFIAIIGVVGAVFFGFCSLYFIFRVIVRKPSVILSSGGLVDNASAIGVGEIKWNEIKNVYIYEYMGQKMLGIDLINNYEIMNRVSTFKRLVFKMNKGLGVAFVNIPQTAVQIKLEDLYTKIELFMKSR